MDNKIVVLMAQGHTQEHISLLSHLETIARIGKDSLTPLVLVVERVVPAFSIPTLNVKEILELHRLEMEKDISLEKQRRRKDPKDLFFLEKESKRQKSMLAKGMARSSSARHLKHRTMI